ncbi:hypothetical protein OsI_14664 [Oryza sativa Indica Group]|uniref:Uncharacterized protein n=1 Tax=Oryza sativa subsp. indica TaxID=39946 RepID=B8AUK5_ORYSI|nr:hypothetical protein OsI_14664 [Oryza sativa Indica Group]
MDSATGAMGSLLLKLGELAMDEYNLQKGVKRNVEALRREMESMQAALRKVGDAPSDQLDEQVELWARDVRELSYDADDVVDTFMVRVRVDDDNHGSKGMVMNKVAGFLRKAKTRHDIADEIKGIMERAREVAARRDRYKVDAVVARFNNGAAAAATGGCDPRLYGLYRDEAELVGIDEASDELMNALATETVVSVVGGGGLGKTTLARAVCNRLKPQFDCTAFVSVSSAPDIKKVFKDMLLELDRRSFIHPEKDGDNLFELADNYFNELINRSLIQPSGYVSGMPHSCRVHDMIHDLIRSLSSKENFVTVLDGISQQTSPASKVRRLSLQNNKLENSTAQTNLKMSQVRSLSIFSSSGVSLLPSLSSFQVLRVLDLENCYLTEGCHLDLRHVCNLFHLRYLRLYECNFDRELLKEIENLKFLQTLDCKKRNTILPEGMDNLTLLEELSLIDINKSPNFAKELRNLMKLRELELFWGEMNESLEEALIESLCNLHRIQNLQIFPFGNSSLDFIGERWMPSVYLQRFVATGSSRFTIVPAWIRKNPSLLTNLTNLSIKLQELRQEDLKALGRLPALLNLRLYAGRSECLLTCVGEFCCLRSFNLRSRDSLRLTFHQGAMPRVQRVLLSFHVQDGNGDFDFGLENLLSLEHADVFLSQTTGTIDNDMEMERAKSALRHAALIHPNHPTLEIH